MKIKHAKEVKNKLIELEELERTFDFIYSNSHNGIVSFITEYVYGTNIYGKMSSHSVDFNGDDAEALRGFIIARLEKKICRLKEELHNY